MPRFGCNLSFFFSGRKSHSGKDIPDLARRREPLRGPGWLNYNIIRRSSKTGVNPVCYAASLGLVRVQAQQRLKGGICHCCGCLRDMWRSRVLFRRAPIPNAGQSTTLVTVVVNLGISRINFYPRPRHTHP